PIVTVTRIPSRIPLPVRRDLRFDLPAARIGDWHGSGAHVAHFFNALSIFFPAGERFFIHSVRHYRDRVTDPELQKAITAFIGQEAMHGREHEQYNELLAQAGLPIQRMEGRVNKILEWGKKKLPAISQLSATIALEHFTAIMADVLLSDPRVLEGADPRMAALWRWHAIEETEHKAVAFDVYRAVAPGLRGWLLRCLIMLSTTAIFWAHTLLNYFHFTRRDGIGFWRAAWRFLWNGFVDPGPLRRIQLPWLSYFRPGFHPWNHDNRRHVDRWKAAYAAAGRPPAS
ncbi:MAG: metal-dependent hydrolase, partial [Stenotrophobium sp.]